MIIDALSQIILALVALAAALVFILPEHRRRVEQRRWAPRSMIDEHTNGRAGALSLHERTYPLRAQADIHRWIAAELATILGQTVLHGLHRSYGHETLKLTNLLSDEDGPNSTSVCQPSWSSIDIGDDQPLAVLSGSVFWLGRLAGHPVVLLLSPSLRYGNPAGWYVGLAAPTEVTAEAAQAFFAKLEAGLARSACYRGKALMLSGGGCGVPESPAISVQRLPAVTREQLILPDVVLRAVERNVIDHARAADALVRRGQSARKGILLHGPPGTGKTHCIRWLISALPDHTTLLIAAEHVAYLDEYMALARLLQPALVVIEDVDLIARERSQMQSPGQESLLNKLLNEMDGLRSDARITFILTTNRPDAIEPAIAARPGRVDQAINFPLPDAADRRRLVMLYAAGQTLTDETIDEVVRRTDGAAPAFIKELLRRSILQAELRQSGAAIERKDLDGALEELLAAGGVLSRRLLGAGS
jgi:cell division protease FtsH